MDGKEIQPVHPKGNQSWIFIGRSDVEAETPILWPPHAKNWLIGKDPDAGKDWRWKEKGMTEDEMVGWHHWCDGHEFEEALGIGDGQGDLEFCSSWGLNELDMTEQRNWTELNCNRVGHDWSDLAAVAAAVHSTWGFPGGTSGKEPAHQCKRCKRRELLREDEELGERFEKKF